MKPDRHLLRRRNPIDRRQRWRRRLLLIAAIMVPVLSALAGVSVYLSRHGEKSLPVRLAERVASWFVPPDYAFAGRDRLNILVVGADYDYDNKARPLPRPARSDTILIVSLSRNGKAAILSIPRDTIVRFNGKLHKINAAHAIGGPELLQQVLAEQFGIETHHFVQITFDAFVKLVDLVGGVDLFVEYDMHYDDNWGKLHIHLQRGLYHLDGEQAIGFVRYRGKGYRRYCPKCKVKIEHFDPRGDLGRVERQQQFLKALAKKLLESRMIVKLPQLISIAHRYVATDMDLRTLLSLANFAKQLNLDAIQTATLSGKEARHPRLGSIIIPDKEKDPKVLSELLGATFLAAAWEQGAGSLGMLVRVAARPAKAAKPPVPRTRRGGREEASEAQTVEGVPINHEPIEVVPVEPAEPSTPSPPPTLPGPPKSEPPSESPNQSAPSGAKVPTNPSSPTSPSDTNEPSMDR